MENNSKVSKLKKELELYTKRGYFLNPDENFTNSLLESLLTNEKRYGYQSCPCRLAYQDKQKDLDIICPCIYRDPDLMEFGACYCGLYVNESIKNGLKKIMPIPDRRNTKKGIVMEEQTKKDGLHLTYPVWRCSVCGYVCARTDAPEICPICGAKHDRFEKFIES